MITIKDITGKTVEVTDIDAAIRQCEMCKNSPFKTPFGHTVGEDHSFMLEQLKQLKNSQRRSNLLVSAKQKMEQGKRLTKKIWLMKLGVLSIKSDL